MDSGNSGRSNSPVRGRIAGRRGQPTRQSPRRGDLVARIPVDGVEPEPEDSPPMHPLSILKLLILIVLFFMGITILVSSHPLFKTNMAFRLIGPLLMLFSGWMLVSSTGRSRSDGIQVNEKGKFGRLRTGDSIGERILSPLSTSVKDRSSLILPISGALIIDAVLIYNWALKGGLNYYSMGTYDFVTISFGLTLVLYNFIPNQFSWMRDFFTFFIIVAFGILVVPRLVMETLLGSGEGSGFFTENLLVKPVSGLVRLMGIESDTVGDTLIVYFDPPEGVYDRWQVGIGEACSGIYTATIFIAAYISFVLMEYRKFDRLVVIFLVVGIITAYLANILRITLIVWIGYRFDGPMALNTEPANTNFWFAHTNLGWIIFILWILPFWYLIFRYMLGGDDSEKSEKGKDAIKE